MDPWQLLLVAFVQGFTEFLPISSSAHLILLPRLLGSADQGLLVDIAAHTGTFLAAVVYFRRDLRDVVKGLVAPSRTTPDRVASGRQLAVLLIVATGPILLAGWFFRGQIATVARDPALIGATSIVFAIVLAIADRRGRREVSVERLGSRQALMVGCAQALALIPGTSRSGITISAGLFLHMRRDEAARFSFLLSMPVSAAVAVVSIFDLVREPVAVSLRWELLLVLAVSGVVGHACISLFVRFVRSRNLTVFVLYRLFLGVVILAFLWF